MREESPQEVTLKAKREKVAILIFRTTARATESSRIKNSEAVLNIKLKIR